MPDRAAILSQWARLGAMFNVLPAASTPDIEKLLVRTAATVPAFARLLPMAVSWMMRYHRLVCRHRLAVLADQIELPRQSAALGYLLTLAGQRARVDHFNQAMGVCRPLPSPQPLFDVYRRNTAMIALAKDQADPTGTRWGLWAPPERLYTDAIRPVKWVMGENPSLMSRAMFGGKLPASILVILQGDPHAGRSESALSRACRATRSAIRDALRHLELCRLIRRKPSGAATQILLPE